MGSLNDFWHSGICYQILKRLLPLRPPLQTCSHSFFCKTVCSSGHIYMDMNKHQYLQCSSWLNRCHIWYNKEIKNVEKQHPHLEFSLRHHIKDLASKKPIRKSCQVFVKWVRVDGTSIIDPSFCYQVGKKYTCSDFKKGETVDTGYHVLPVDVALSFGIQFGLSSEGCKPLVCNLVSRHGFRLLTFSIILYSPCFLLGNSLVLVHPA